MGGCSVTSYSCALVVVAAALLSGCTPSSEEAHPAITAATGSGLAAADIPAKSVRSSASGVVELGAFDPDAPSFSLFDPCTETPPEELEKMFGKFNTNYPPAVTEKYASCHFIDETDPLDLQVNMMRSDKLQWDEVVKRGGIYPAPQVSGLDGARYFRLDPNKAESCSVSVPTTRGRLSVYSLSGHPGWTGEQACLDVSKKAQRLIDLTH